MLKSAASLTEGELVNFPPVVVQGTSNEDIANYEYGEVEQVGGGWAEHLAKSGQVVIYLANYHEPVIISVTTMLEVEVPID